MIWLFSHVWLWVLLSAVLGFAITLYAMLAPRRHTSTHPAESRDEAVPATRQEKRAAAAAAAEPKRRRVRSYEIDDVDLTEWQPGDRF